METEVVSGLTAYGPGYINEEMKDLEQVVGLQTDKPLKRAFMPYGGIKMAEQLVQHTDMSQARNCTRSSQNIIKHTTREYSISTHLR